MRHLLGLQCECSFLFFLFICCAAQAQQINWIKRSSLSPRTNAQGQGPSYDSTIDGSGNFVAFTSYADNFAGPGNTAGKFWEHAYVRDVASGRTIQLDATADGKSGFPSHKFTPEQRTFDSSFDTHLSRDGKYAVFISTDTNLTADAPDPDSDNWVFLKSLETGAITRLPFASNIAGLQYPSHVAINADGSVIVIVSIADNDAWELNVYERATGQTLQINTGVVGNKFDPAISDDGRFIVFENQNDSDFMADGYSYLLDRSTGQVSALNGGKPAEFPAISGNGAVIAYADVSVLESPIHILDRESGTVTVASPPIRGGKPNGISGFPSLDQSGRYIAFNSDASNLVPDDTNGMDDIFVYDRLSNKTILVSVQSACKSGLVSKEEFNTGPPSISADGKTIAFSVLERLISADTRLPSGESQPADSNIYDDVYVASIDYDAVPPVFNGSLKPAAPLVTVNCTGELATINLNQVSTKSSVSSGAHSSDTKITKITQTVLIQKAAGSQLGSFLKKQTSKKLQLSAGKLRPGTYIARVKIDARYANGKTESSKVGAPSKFTISK